VTTTITHPSDHRCPDLRIQRRIVNYSTTLFDIVALYHAQRFVHPKILAWSVNSLAFPTPSCPPAPLFILFFFPNGH
jgi:hypothetical protein